MVRMSVAEVVVGGGGCKLMKYQELEMLFFLSLHVDIQSNST
jgi:hypothetical protein